MINAVTKRTLSVETDGGAGPYLELPVSQLDEVRQLLDAHGVRYQVEETYISFNGGPEEATIDLGRDADAGAVQALLDGMH